MTEQKKKNMNIICEPKFTSKTEKPKLDKDDGDGRSRTLLNIPKPLILYLPFQYFSFNLQT